MYEQFEQHHREATEKWRVVAQFQDGKAGAVPEMAAKFTDDWMTRHVEAEADTGSRYVVVATRLGIGGRREGGDVLVTVLWPWQDAWPLSAGGYLDDSYIAEHLCGGRGRNLNGGDLAALSLTIRHALGREH